MKPKFLLILSVGIGLLINTCIKDDSEEITYEEAIQLESLSEEEVVFWDNQESIELDVNEVLLPNGLTVEEFLLQTDPELKDDVGRKSSGSIHSADPFTYKNLLIINLIKATEKYTNRDNFQFLATEEGPKQDGLAYSFGQKDHTIRVRPPGDGDCIEKIHGLDCSGLIYRIFLESRINLMDGNITYANYQRKPLVLESAIKQRYPKYDKIKVKDLGKKDPEDFESGDIIYWLKRNERGILVAFHIGIIAKNRDGVLAVAQSNGTDVASNDCAGNYGPSRGPGFKSLLEATLPKNQGGLFCTEHGYGIVRIGVDPPPDLPDYNQISVMIKVYAQYQGFMGSQDNNAIQGYRAYTGGFKKDNLFEAEGTFIEQMGTLKVSGTIQAQFNYACDTIYWLKWSEVKNKSASQYVKPYREIGSCRLVKVPKSEYPKVFEVKGGTTGSDPCNHIEELDHTWDGENNSSLKNWLCTWKSHVFVALDKK